MRNNQPITGREYHLRDDQSLISRTDTKGRITYFNKDFLEASGFDESELLGKAHNVVRHPDMPEEAFADMWRELEAGNSWTGMVKNRRKNGDHYWVLANATPVSENGVVVGYTSVRTRPGREQVEEAAAAYARFKSGSARGLRICKGKVVRRGFIGALARVARPDLRTRVAFALAVPALLSVCIGLYSLHALQAGRDASATHFWVLGGLMSVAMLATIGMGLLLARGILHPVSHALDVIKQIAAGNLTSSIRIKGEDEIGQMLHALEVMRKSINNIIHGVKDSADTVQQGAREIASGNHDLSRRTEQQAATLEEAASSIEELTSTVQHNAGNARSARDLSDAASRIALQGGESMARVVETMETINADAGRISDITTVIEGIAFQTNILALNAAVEAARAGEHGRGFAVVAAEVRTLAQRASTASREIKHLVDTSVAGIRTGAEQVAQAQKTIDEVVRASRQAAALVGDIAHATAEQSEGIEQVHKAVSHLDQVTQQNAALVEQAAAASGSLENQGASLSQGVGVFKLAGRTATRSAMQ